MASFLSGERVAELWAKVKAALGLKMDAATYDPQGRGEDVFGYVDTKVDGYLPLTGGGMEKGATIEMSSGASHSATQIKNFLDGQSPTFSISHLHGRTMRSATLCLKLSGDDPNNVSTEAQLSAYMSKLTVHMNGMKFGNTWPNPSDALTVDLDGNAWFAGDVYVHSTGGTNKDEGSVKLATVPLSRAVTLTAAGWDAAAKTQTISVAGVLADETAQAIHWTPAMASQEDCYGARVRCTGQGANSLSFTCDTVPTGDLTIFVTMQEVRTV